jgi:hypothetical protein
MNKLNGVIKGQDLPKHYQVRLEHVYRRDTSDVLNSQFEFSDGVLIKTNLD